MSGNIFRYLVEEKGSEYSSEQLEVLKMMDDELTLTYGTINPQQKATLNKIGKLIENIPKKKSSDKLTYVPRINKVINNLIWKTENTDENKIFLIGLNTAKDSLALMGINNLMERFN